MVDNIVTAVALLLWATTLVEALILARHHHREPTQTWLLIAFGLLALATTFSIPGMQTFSAQASGIPNISEPLARTALLGTSWAGQMLLLRLQHHTDARTWGRRRTGILAMALIALWTLFALAPVHQQTQRLTAQYGSHPVVAAYIGISLAYFAFAIVDFLRAGLRYAPAAPPALATGLRLISLGCGFGLGYIIVKATFLAFLLAGQQMMGTGLESALTRSLTATGSVLVIAGSLLPFTTTRATRARTWLDAYRNLHRLYPLWALLQQATPQIALDPPTSARADALRLRDIEFRLYRRVIEIRDGRLALTPYLDATVADTHHAAATAQGLPPEQAAASPTRKQPSW